MSPTDLLRTSTFTHRLYALPHRAQAEYNITLIFPPAIIASAPERQAQPIQTVGLSRLRIQEEWKVVINGITWCSSRGNPGSGPNVSIRNLSEEVILEILESGPIERGDLMHLCLACKRLRRIAIPRLYKKIQIAGNRCLHQLLRSILQNVSFGEMVKTLALEWYGYTDVELPSSLNDPSNQIQDWESEFGVKELKDLAAAARTRALDPDIVQALARGSESAKAIILISSLPNLRVLSVQPDFPTTFFDIHFTRLATDGQSFPNLKKFDWKWCETNSLLPAMLIPSLTILVGSAVSSDDNNDYDDDKDLGAGTSNVTCLALQHSKVTGRELSRILRIPKALRHFSFSDGGSTVDYVSCSKEEFGRGLACTSRTLEYLSIEWDDYPEDDDSTLGSLQGFKRLRVLSVEFDVLLGVESDAAVDLASVLPQTIEQLFLLRGHNGSWTEAEYLGSIETLIRAKGGSLMPTLSFIGLQPGPELLVPLLNFAAEKGIEIALQDPQQTTRSYKTFPTHWYPLSEEILE